jgi:hypothetical protein
MVFEEPDEVRGDAEGVHLLLVVRRHGPHEAQDCCHEQRLGSLWQLVGSDCDELPVRYPGRLHAARFVLESQELQAWAACSPEWLS